MPYDPLVAEPTPEVLNELVRLMNGESNYEEMSLDALYALGAAARRGALTVHEVVLELRRRDQSFAQMAERWQVDPATPTRWATPPSPPGRRPRTDKTLPDE